MACLHRGGGPQVGEVTSALFNVQAFFAKILALFSAVSKRNEISWKYIRKCEMSRKSVQKMVQKSKIESRRIFENSSGPSFRKDIYRNYPLDAPGNMRRVIPPIM